MIISLDFETSIGSSIHGPTFREPKNDVYTQIWGFSDTDVKVDHDRNGFNRKLSRTLDGVDLIVGHNIGFDLSYVWHDGKLQYYIKNNGKIWDTQVAEYLLTGQQHGFSSLAELQLKHLGQIEKPNRISGLFKKKIGADAIVGRGSKCPRLWTLYNKYCHLDGSTPLKIYSSQLKRAKTLGMLPIIELFNDYLLSIINMTVTGISLDVAKCEKTLREFNLQYVDYLEQAQNILKQYWTNPKLPTFNVNSPDHKSAVLFGGIIKVKEKQADGLYKNGNPKFRTVEKNIWVDGFKVPTSISSPSKKEGFYKTDDNVMSLIGEKTKNPQLKQYCVLQKKAMMFKKAAKTYCQAWLERSVDGILSPNFNNTLTTTGRLSSSEPNLQNVSKRNEFGKILHSLFIAPEGWKCVQIDFSQLEIWVLAMLSGDKLLTEHLLSGVDLHVVRLGYYNEDKTYDELYKLCKIDKDEYWDKQRTYAKTVSYQMAYGAMPKKVAASTGLDIEIVETIFNKEAETYTCAANFGVQVRETLSDDVTYSKGSDIPANQKKGKGGSRIHQGVELLPIFDKDNNVVYNEQHQRRVGYYTSPLGQRFHFLDTGRFFKGHLSKSFSFTQPKNYPMQGTAACIQGATTAALLPTLLNKADRIKMINEVHDSKWFYVREDVLEPCLKWLKDTIEDVPKILEKRFGLNTPFKFPCDIEVGDNFGDMVKYNFS